MIMTMLGNLLLLLLLYTETSGHIIKIFFVTSFVHFFYPPAKGIKCYFGVTVGKSDKPSKNLIGEKDCEKAQQNNVEPKLKV